MFSNYLFDDVSDRDLVGLTIRNTESVQDKVVGISFRTRHQLKPDVIWGVLGTDHVEVHLSCLLVTVVRRRNGDL